MYINADDSKKICNIWVENSEKETYKNSDMYKETVEKYTTKHYAVNVFIGGQKPLLPVVSMLLDQQSSDEL